ncbi:MAG: hypothetical protein KGJ12_01595, partial [Gammaproteobacteria bacterium]|nr:hypothetical protein [Gammaproteobacteria bacterium]
MGRTLNLVVPDLLGRLPGGEAARDLRIPATERLLARADRDVDAAGGFETRSFTLFGVESDPRHDLPVAAVTRLIDSPGTSEGWWLRADPVHLRPERDHLIVFDARLLDIRREEAQALVEEFNAAFGADGGRLEAATPERWYLSLAEDPGIRTHALRETVGRNPYEFLPQGEQGARWRRFLSEVQMLFHDSRVNAAREQRGEPALNSVWFWGAGRAPARVHADWARVWSDEPLARGLARIGGIEHAPAPATAADWLAQTGTEGAHLVVLETLCAGAWYGDRPAWRNAVQRFESE